MMAIRLSDHFSYRRLLRFTFPSIVMMIFTSLYTIVDGIFVSNVVGNEAFAALNLVYPLIQVLGAFGFMMGAGGSALVSATMGEGEADRARRLFSMILSVVTLLGIVLAALSLVFLRPFCEWMGAAGGMMQDCLVYGGILLILQPFFFLQNCFQNFLIAAERPKLGLVATGAAGLTNMVLDYMFMVPFGMGIAGAAWATTLSWVVGAAIPLVFFSRKNGTPLWFTKPVWDMAALSKSMTNGVSELVTNLSLSVVNMIYNLELMKFLGSDGVVAYGIIQYVAFTFIAVFLGYSMASAPIISYQYGAENHAELKNLLKKSLVLVTAFSICMVAIAEITAPALAFIFVSYSEPLLKLTTTAIRIYSISFLICGYNIFASSFFTALNDGFVSAVLSFVRTFVFQVGSIWIMAEWLGADGIWMAVIVAELLALGMSWAFLKGKQKKYGY